MDYFITNGDINQEDAQLFRSVAKNMIGSPQYKTKNTRIIH